jgi:uncharacterized membrane protein
MIKKNMKTLLLTSVIALLPMIVGIVLWNKLPDPLATHFNFNGKPDGYTSKWMTVFIIPLFLVLVEWVSAFFTVHSPKAEHISNKIFTLVLWIIPCVSLMMMITIYGYALGLKINMVTMANVFMGTLLLVIGNYLPKTRQNYVIGIKLPWTLDDEENWNKTHRFASRLWIIVGVVIMVASILNILSMVIAFILVIAAAIVPMIYSFIFYKNKKRCRK